MDLGESLICCRELDSSWQLQSERHVVSRAEGRRRIAIIICKLEEKKKEEEEEEEEYIYV